MEKTDRGEDKLKIEASRLEHLIKVVQLRTAYVVFAGVVLTSFTTWIQVSEVLRKMNLLVTAPLEGEWLFKSNYEKYYDEEKPELLSGKGNAVMIWRPRQKRYDIYLTYGIHRSGGAELRSGGSDLLAATFKGLLWVDEEGLPQQENFTMSDFVILTRQHYKDYPPSLRTYQFTNCHYVKKKNQDHVGNIKCDFITPQTKSKIELTWNGPLHE